MKNKLILFILIFSVGVLTIYPSFVNSHSLDSYCTMYNGYKDAAESFLQNGKIFSALAFTLFNTIKLPFDSLSFISSFLTVLFLTFAVIKVYLTIKENLKLSNNLKQLILLVSAFLLFFNPLLIETLVMDDGFVLALGILFITISACEINKGKVKNYLFALVFALLASLCYQGVICYLLPIVVLCLLSSKENTSVKKIIISLSIYVVSFIIPFIAIKTLPSFNISNIFEIFVNAFKSISGFVNPMSYFIIDLILLAAIIYLLTKSEDKKTKAIYLVALVLISVIAPFLPYLAVKTSHLNSNMLLLLGAFPSLLVIYIISSFEINVKVDYAILIAISLMLIMTAYSLHQNTMINFKRYKEDVKYIKTINEKIAWYEKKYDTKIKTIYFAKDTNVNYYYDFGNNNGTNIRLMAIPWALNCAFDVYSENKYEYKKMSKKDYNKYFKGKNYNKFNDKEFVFDKEKLYLLLY